MSRSCEGYRVRAHVARMLYAQREHVNDVAMYYFVMTVSGMTQLEELRTKIDDVDREIVAMIARRFVITRRVGTLKKAMTLPATDRSREETLIASCRALAEQHSINADLIEKIFREIIEVTKAEHRAVSE